MNRRLIGIAVFQIAFWLKVCLALPMDGGGVLRQIASSGAGQAIANSFGNPLASQVVNTVMGAISNTPVPGMPGSTTTTTVGPFGSTTVSGPFPVGGMATGSGGSGAAGLAPVGTAPVGLAPVGTAPVGAGTAMRPVGAAPAPLVGAAPVGISSIPNGQVNYDVVKPLSVSMAYGMDMLVWGAKALKTQIAYIRAEGARTNGQPEKQGFAAMLSKAKTGYRLLKTTAEAYKATHQGEDNAAQIASTSEGNLISMSSTMLPFTLKLVRAMRYDPSQR